MINRDIAIITNSKIEIDSVFKELIKMGESIRTDFDYNVIRSYSNHNATFSITHPFYIIENHSHWELLKAFQIEDTFITYENFMNKYVNRSKKLERLIK